MDFGQWLKHKRQALDFTQDTFAEEVNCAVDTIRKIESGRRRPSRQMADLLADYLKVPPDEHAAFVQWARGLSTQEQSNGSTESVPEETGEHHDAEETVSAPWSTLVSLGQTSTIVASPPSAPPGITEATASPTISPLPFAPTPLVGRERELAEACALLWRSTTRLTTLIGPPGIGKTRLALAISAALKDDFKDGLSYIPLIGVADPALVPSAIAQGLGVKEQAGKSTPMEAIEIALRDKQTLLVLDNFEQVVEAAPILAQIMSAAPQVKFLVTSRSPLHLRGEKLMNVPPLALPVTDRVSSVEELARIEAIALFVERAQDAVGSFALTPDNAPLVAAICAELDGLPLAIELAAAKIRLLSLPALHARLIKPAGQLNLLTGGSRDAPAHQQTLRHSVASSYTLLGNDEQRLFRHLGIFAGPFDFEMAEEIAGATLEGLEAILDQSLVRRQQPAGISIEQEAPEGAWFAMLASIREYALEQLEAASEAEDLALRHAQYFLDLSESARPHMLSPAQGFWMNRLIAVQADLRATLAWGLGQEKRMAANGQAVAGIAADENTLKERRGIALQISAKLYRYWERQAGISEGRRWLEEALAQSQDQPAEWRAYALYILGSLLWIQTDLPAARKSLEESIELYKETDNLPSLSKAYNNLANVFFYEGKYEEARTLYNDALTLNRQFDMKVSIAHSLSNLGGIALMLGDFDQAEKLQIEGLAIRREMNNPWDIVLSLNNLAETMQSSGNHIRAREYAEEGLALSRELGDKHSASMALVSLGEAIASLGEQERGLLLTAEGLKTFRDMGDKQACIEGLEAFAGILSATGQPLKATRIYGALETLRQVLSLPIDPNKQINHKKWVEVARDTLSAPDFQAAWTVGQGMSLEEAVQYALQA